MREYNIILKTIKMKPVDVKPETYIDFIPTQNTKKPSLRLVIMNKFRSINTFSQNAIH